MRVAVTYDLVTEESAQDGDNADHGYIDARTERRRSYALGRKRDIERNQRQSRAGKFDFPSLREAMRFIDAQNWNRRDLQRKPWPKSEAANFEAWRNQYNDR